MVAALQQDSERTGALGPEPSAVLDDGDALDLARNVSRRFGSDERKRRALQRYLIYKEDYAQLVVEKLETRQSDEDTRAQMRKHIVTGLNPALDICRKLCVVYREGAQRRVEGVGEAQQEAFKDALRESRIAQLAMHWHRAAFILGPVAVIPVIARSGKLRFDTLLPHFYDVLRDPDDHMGTPSAVAWTVRPDHDTPMPAKADTVVLDGAAWRYYRTTRGDLELIDVQEHGVGVFPGSILRLDTPFDDDWYGSSYNTRVAELTVEVAFVATAMSFVRKTQNKKLMTIIGNIDKGLAKGQTLDPEHPLVGETDEDGDLDISAIDFDTAIENFKAHIRFYQEQLIEAFGIPDSAVSHDPKATTGGERLSVTHQGLTEIRNEHIPHCRDFESDLWPKAVQLMQGQRHRLAGQLPPVDAVRSGFVLEIPPLARTFADPAQERDHYDWELSRGQTSEFQLMRNRHPHLTETQIKALVEKNLEERADFLEELASRGLSGGEGGVRTAQEAFGAMGPAVRDGQAQPPDDGEDDNDD